MEIDLQETYRVMIRKSLPHRMQGLASNAEAKIVDAQKPELASAQFSHIFTAFGELVSGRTLISFDCG